MKTVSKVLLGVSLLVGLLGTPLLADANKGKKIFMKKFKSKVKMKGADFAGLHTQDEWKALFENKGEGFIEVYSKKYPKASKAMTGKKSWKKLEHLGDFLVMYASDSGNVPSCD